LCLFKNTRRFGRWLIFHHIKIIYKTYSLSYSALYPENSSKQLPEYYTFPYVLLFLATEADPDSETTFL